MKNCSFLSTLFLIFPGALAILPSLVTSAGADMLLVDMDPPDTKPTYWPGSDDNPSDWMELNNADPTGEDAWLEALLGVLYDDP